MSWALIFRLSIGVLSAFVSQSSASGCARVPTLPAMYDYAASILLVEVTACDEGNNEPGQFGTEVLCYLKVVEVIKGKSSLLAKTYNDSGRKLYPIPGELYTLVLGEDGVVENCGTTRVKPTAKKVEFWELIEAINDGTSMEYDIRLKEYQMASRLQALLDYRDGKRKSLWDYWRVKNGAYKCVLGQRHSDKWIGPIVGFIFWHSDFPEAMKTDVDGSLPQILIPANGEPLETTPGDFSFVVAMPGGKRITDSQGILSIAGKKHQLLPEMKNYDGLNPSIRSLYRASGAVAKEIFDTLFHQSGVAFTYYSEGRDEAGLSRSIEIESGLYLEHSGPALEEFKACIQRKKPM